MNTSTETGLERFESVYRDVVRLMRGEVLQVETAEYGVVTCGPWQAAVAVQWESWAVITPPNRWAPEGDVALFGDAVEAVLWVRGLVG